MKPAIENTPRFQVRRKLGEGGMGVVYEAYDSKWRTNVAVKTLRSWDANAFLRFKEEFRAYHNLAHPNLLQLGELVEDQGQWFFTMELIDGEDILTHLRRVKSETQLDFEETIRPIILQLVRGLRALHNAGKVHCDIKPTNILVTSSGRLVVIDYGLASDALPNSSASLNIAGTPAYMAPEVMEGDPPKPASDWYSVGVLLYQVLTGDLPFAGGFSRMMGDKLRPPRLNPKTHWSGMSVEWADLVNSLLDPKPENRPTAAVIAEAVGAPDGQLSSLTLIHNRGLDMDGRPTFVGRGPELAQMREILATVESEKRGQALYIYGEPGVGKSAIMRHFTTKLREERAHLLFLTGRCYQHETIPYKAVDGVIDRLSRVLARFSKWETRELFPDGSELLARVFPALNRIDAIANLPPSPQNFEPQELRRRIFALLRTLFTRISRQIPVVMMIDDLQWADSDSLLLLQEVLRPPGEPALLILGTIRENAFPASLTLPGEPREIHLKRLDETESQELLEHVLSNVEPTTQINKRAILREANGHPLFIDELVRHHLECDGEDRSSENMQLNEAIWERALRLEKPAIQILEMLSLCPSALEQTAAEHAAGIEGIDGFKHIKKLSNSRFIRTTRTEGGTVRLEPYHDCVRAAVRSHLDVSAQQAHHRRIARSLESLSHGDAAELAAHWTGAGSIEKAAVYLEKAAKDSDNALAFDRAAHFYRECLELIPPDAAHRRRLQEKLADALANGGHGREAGFAYRAIENAPTPEKSLELKRKAADQFLRSGNVDEGVDELFEVLAAFELEVPKTGRGAVFSFLWGSFQLSVRGWKYYPRATSQLPHDVLAKADACWAATVGLSMVDTVRAIDFHVRHMRLALDAGEPSRIVRGLAMEYGLSTGWKGSPGRRARAALALAKSITKDNPSLSVLNGTIAASQAFAEYFQGHWKEAHRFGVTAEETLRHEGKGVAWEHATARRITCWSLCFLGRVNELSSTVDEFLRESLERGDQYAAMGVRSGFPNIGWLIRDQVGRAKREADDAIGQWSSRGFYIQHLWDLYAQTHIHLYEGDAEAAYRRVSVANIAIEQSELLRFSWNRILFSDVQIRSALAFAAKTDGKEAALEVAAAGVARLRAEQLGWCEAIASMGQAGIEYLRGRTTHAINWLEKARDGFVRLDMRMHAASAQSSLRRIGMAGPASILDSYFIEQQVVRPDRIIAIFAPWLPP